jgi:hypothetical protein
MLNRIDGTVLVKDLEGFVVVLTDIMSGYLL